MIVDKLRTEKVQNTTKNNYYSAWKAFNDFFISLDIKPDNWEDRVILFIGFLIEYKKVKSQTVKSYISAIKSVLYTYGKFKLNEDKFLLTSLTRACKLQNDTVRIRLPIKKSLLG